MYVYVYMYICFSLLSNTSFHVIKVNIWLLCGWVRVCVRVRQTDDKREGREGRDRVGGGDKIVTRLMYTLG